MESLQDILSYYANHKNIWLYYDPRYFHCNVETALKNHNNAFCFIHEYFSAGNKSDVFDSSYLEQNIDVIKSFSIHTVSTFFLGLKIAGCLDIEIPKRNNGNMSFQYFWFLACLYHDMGYVFEKRSVPEQLEKLSSKGLEAIQEISGISYIDESVFKTYSKDIVNTYLKNRALYQKKIDHGIIGGLLLYDGLRKQFEKAWESIKDDNSSREDFCIKVGKSSLHYSCTHFEAYAEAADAIITHNIWLNTLQDYLSMSDLSYQTLKRISPDNYLCFILGLADSIEPLKRKPDCIDQVFFSFDRRCFSIILDNEVYKCIYESIKDKVNWLNVRVVISEDGTRRKIRFLM